GRHLDTGQYQTILHARPPRTQCAEHGVRVVKLRWAELSSGFTVLMERLVIDWLRAASQKAVGEQLGLSWDEIHGIMERAVERGLERRQAEPLPQLGVDEKAFRKGHKYFTLVNDLERSRVLVRGRRSHPGKFRWILGDADGRAAREYRGDSHGYVGSLRGLGERAPAGREQKDRLRQISYCQTSGRGRGQGTAQGKPHAASGGR